MEMSCKEAAEILKKPHEHFSVHEYDITLTSAYVEAIEVALEALEGVEVQGQIIVNLNRDMRAMRKAMNGQSEYAYLGGDLISREALTERVEMINWYSVNDRGVLHSGAADNESAYIHYADVCQVIKDALAVEAKPVVHAHWVKMTPDQRPFLSPNYTHVCSKCGAGGYKHYKRCYDCGAIMDEKVFEPTLVGKWSFTNRVRKRLKQAGIETMEQLESTDMQTLLCIPGFGKQCLLEVEEELRIWNKRKEKDNELLERQVSE